MCEYCDPNKGIQFFDTTTKQQVGISLGLGVWDEDAELVSDLCFEGNEIMSESFPVNYCPICGRGINPKGIAEQKIKEAENDILSYLGMVERSNELATDSDLYALVCDKINGYAQFDEVLLILSKTGKIETFYANGTTYVELQK